MRAIRCLNVLPIAACLLFIPSSPSQAQISVQIGAEPGCPYGYYDTAPYGCAPYGYYGPEWFSSGVFIGAGPWFHGPDHFRGHVNNHYDVHHGYKGPMPQRGDHPDTHPQGGKFHGNEYRDGHGHSGKK